MVSYKWSILDIYFSNIYHVKWALLYQALLFILSQDGSGISVGHALQGLYGAKRCGRCFGLQERQLGILSLREGHSWWTEQPWRSC